LPSGRKSRKARGKKGKQEAEVGATKPEEAKGAKDAPAFLGNI